MYSRVTAPKGVKQLQHSQAAPKLTHLADRNGRYDALKHPRAA